MTIQDVPLTRIRTDGGTQLRPTMDVEALNEYARLLQEGVTLPAINLVYDGKDYWLWDGFHRYDAAHRAGLHTYPADVEAGTLDDAREKALAANAKHGIRRDSGYIKRVVLLAHERHPNESNVLLGRRCNLSDTTIGRYRPAPTSNELEDDKRPMRLAADGRMRPATRPARSAQRPPYEEADSGEEDPAQGNQRVARIFSRAALHPKDTRGMRAREALEWFVSVTTRVPFQPPSDEDMVTCFQMTDPEHVAAQVRRLRRVGDQITHVLGIYDEFVRPGPRRTGEHWNE
jgi:hypothetical protein